MGTAVLISIRPKWCELIASGKKTIEVRKTAPKIPTPFKCYIYCTQNTTFNPNVILHYEDPEGGIYYAGKNHSEFMTGTVIGEFVCNEIDVYDYVYCTHPEIGMDYDCGDNWFCIDNADLEKACLSYEDFRLYANDKDMYGWHISDLLIYDTPKELSEFHYCGTCEYGLFCNDDKTCKKKMQRPPQSWCYVEEIA